MPNLKDLKLRIQSVKSTQKITKAMKMVAAAKLRRAQERAEAAKPYAQKMNEMLGSLANDLQSKGDAPKLLIGTGNDAHHLLVVATSDRGLCGGFNTSVVKLVKAHINELQRDGKQFSIICIGKKGYELLKTSHGKYIIHTHTDLGKNNLSYADAETIASDIIARFGNDEFDVCSLFYNVFKSAISQIPTAQQIIPINVEDQADNDNTTSAPTASEAPYEYEPSEADVSESLLPRNIGVQVFSALLENAASEQGARMSAMDNATRNAGEMINNLTLIYNRTRQAAITTELTEIIAGAEAL